MTINMTTNPVKPDNYLITNVDLIRLKTYKQRASDIMTLVALKKLFLVVLLSLGGISINLLLNKLSHLT